MDQVVDSVPANRAAKFGDEDDDRIAQLRNGLVRYCERLCKSPHFAEDLAQTALLRALPVIAAQSHPNQPALLRRIARNAWIDHVRKTARCDVCEPESVAAMVDSAAPEGTSALEAVLELVMERLTPQQRAVFLLVEGFGYTNAEVAGMLSLNVGAVKATLHRARSRLRLQTPSQLHRTGEITAADISDDVLRALAAAIQQGDVASVLTLVGCGTSIHMCLAA